MKDEVQDLHCLALPWQLTRRCLIPFRADTPFDDNKEYRRATDLALLNYYVVQDTHIGCQSNPEWDWIESGKIKFI